MSSPVVRYIKDPSGLAEKEMFTLDAGTNFLEWMAAHFGDSESMTAGLACDIILNGKRIFNSDAENIDESVLDFSLGNNDSIDIVLRPATGVEIAYIVIAVISVAISVYSYLNMPKLPGAAEGAKESPNNKLNAASNQFRPGEAIPQCFGFGVSYPDFIQPSYYYYQNNIKRQVELMCITEGTVSVPQVRIGETDITAIPGSSANLYLPGESVPNEFLSAHRFAPNIDGQTLLAPDDPGIFSTGNAGTIIQASTGVGRIDIEASVISEFLLEVGSRVRISADYQVEIPPVPPETEPTIEDVNYDEYVTITAISYYSSMVAISFSSAFSFPETSTSATIGIGRALDDQNILDNYVGWFDIPGEEATEIWFHWRCPRGVRTAGGGQLSLGVYFEIQRLDENNDPTGPIISQSETITARTLDPQFRTTQFTGLTAGQYRARMRRTSGVVDINSNASEQIEVEAFVSVTKYAQPNFGDVSILLVQRKATLLGSDASGSKINCDYRRKLPTYNRVTGVYDENTLTETDSFADAVAYCLISKAGNDVSRVNLPELYGIYDNLPDSQLGEFTFTFDDDNVSLGERVEVICNAARTVRFHDGYEWRFSRDEIKPSIGALFNRRNLIGANGKQSWRTQRADDSDSVRIIYVNPDDNTEAYAERRFDLVNGLIVSNEVGNNIKEIKLAGCRNALQAENRADLEIRRIAYQRRSVKDTTYRDALTIDLLDTVAWVDINDLDTFDGEVLAINGNVFDTSERFEPEEGKNYVVFVTDEDGYPSNTVTCLPRSDTAFGFIADGLSSAYVKTGDQQVSSRYFIADADDSAASLFTLTARTPQDGRTVEIELTEYDERMYEAD